MAEPAADMTRRAEETEPVTRKKVLLRVLAEREAQRVGLQVDAAQVARFTARFRAAFGLQVEDELQAWLAHADLPYSDFTALMRQSALIEQLETLYREEIDRAVGGQRALWTAHEWSDARRGA
jgi:hypothetical protein